jgi:hypothetical protein
MLSEELDDPREGAVLATQSELHGTKPMQDSPTKASQSFEEPLSLETLL